MQYFLLLGAGVLLAPLASANLIVNGDFSDPLPPGGLPGFISNYGYYAPVLGVCDTQQRFSITADPSLCSSAWTRFGDHTTGTGEMLVANGAPTNDAVIWSEGTGSFNQGLSSLRTNTEYYFSVRVASLDSENPAQLQFTAHGCNVGPATVLGTLTASRKPGDGNSFSEPGTPDRRTRVCTWRSAI